jgi:membrane-bound lytic murein transglycosylase D
MIRLQRTFVLLGVVGAPLACSVSLAPIPTIEPARAEPIQSPADSAASPAISTAPVPPAGLAVSIPDSLTESIQLAVSRVGASLGISFEPSLSLDPVARDGEGEELSWDLDVTSYATHEQVTRYVGLFTGPARERIQAKLQRGKAYEGMIRQKFRAGGIPEDLYYLALVESGYDPHAYSRAAAVGMWQFMSSTARGVGLRVDHWVDERRDPVRATDAAAKFLGLLYQQFGSYYLAAAAYNGGPGRVSRGLARFEDELAEVVGDDKFFALAGQTYLRAETRNYVPQLIAAALIGKAPARYGMSVSDSVLAFAYDSVQVPALTSLGLVARAVQRPVAEVRDLNPHLLRGVTPPTGNAQVRLPVGVGAAFEAGWAAIAAEERRSFEAVRTGKGQTLGTIARKHGVDARRLAWYNPGLSPTRKLPAGKEVLVPADHVIAASRDVPNPSIERYGTAPASSGRVVHVVRRGESLGLIARRYRTTVASLQRVNGLKRTVVYAGQSIIVGGNGRSSSAKGTTSKAVASKKGAAARKKPAVARKKPAVARKKSTASASQTSAAR